jgi:hypothetical protein
VTGKEQVGFSYLLLMFDASCHNIFYFPLESAKLLGEMAKSQN